VLSPVDDAHRRVLVDAVVGKQRRHPLGVVGREAGRPFVQHPLRSRARPGLRRHGPLPTQVSAETLAAERPDAIYGTLYRTLYLSAASRYTLGATPLSTAQAATCAREWKPSLFRMCTTWT